MPRRILTSADIVTARSRATTDLLAAHFPTFRTRTNILDVPGLARAMGVSHETIYRVTRGTEEVKLGTARRLVRFSHENQDAVPLYLTDIMPFVIHDWDQFGVEPEVDELLG